MPKLHIDIETFSSVDIKKAGAYKYIESPDFEIILIAYAIDDGPILHINPKHTTEQIMVDFTNLIIDPNYELHAHNAAFERLAFNRVNLRTNPDRWHCSMIKAAYCGLPLSLGAVSKALKLGDKGKLNTGTVLINYFCKPCKPTKANGGRTRNLPEHDPEKWAEFTRYCVNDVEAEREIDNRLAAYEIPDWERQNYILDQKINDKGIAIDLQLVNNAININETETAELMKEAKRLTDLKNPNSVTQLSAWIHNFTGEKITSLNKDNVQTLIGESASPVVKRVLEIRQKTSKSSVKKYQAMQFAACSDSRARGIAQFYGANRTGRWAGRIIQTQNLKRNYLKDLDVCREIIRHGDRDIIDFSFSDVNNILSQLVRTAIVAAKGKLLGVADFSAIEARVLAWLAGETWRLDVFKSHGKIYEASASMMFGISIDEIGKGSDLRQQGKIAELALGYGGSNGALGQMETSYNLEPMPEDRKTEIVQRWRHANPNIVAFWKQLEGAAKKAIRYKRPIQTRTAIPLTFDYDGQFLTIELPSGRKLFYYKPSFTVNRFGGESIQYQGMDQTTKQWTNVETYGGKLAENIVQAVSRDLLAFSMQSLDARCFEIVMHVHDEVICEIWNAYDLKPMIETMEIAPNWADGLPLKADGYITKFYKKD